MIQSKLFRSLALLGVSVLGVPPPVFSATNLGDLNSIRDHAVGVIGAASDKFFVGEDGFYFNNFRQGGLLSIGANDTQYTRILPRTPTTPAVELGNGVVLFGYHDNRFGNELWRSDGTREGTYLVKDLVPGYESGLPHLLTPWNGKIIFATSRMDPSGWVYGTGIGLTDGTSDGTIQIADKAVFEARGDYRQTNVNAIGTFSNGWVFSVTRDGWGDGGLWWSDGSTAGTYPVIDSTTGYPFPIDSFIGKVNGLQIGAERGNFHSSILWATDGSSGNTYQLGWFGAVESAQIFNGKLYTIAATPGSASTLELIRTDGTPAGTESLGVVASEVDVESVVEARWVVADGVLYVALVPNVNDLTSASLWRTQGTTDSTVLLTPIGGGNPESIALADNVYFHSDRFWFSNKAGHLAEEPSIQRADGTVVWAGDLIQSRSGYSMPRNFTALSNGVTLFSAYSTHENWESNTGIYSSRGTQESTWNLSSSVGRCSYCDYTDPSNVQFVSFNSFALQLMRGTNPDGLQGLVRTDGTTEGTSVIKPFTFGQLYRNRSAVAVTGSKAVFMVYERDPNDTQGYNNNQIELWRSDGTAGGTVQVKSLSPALNTHEAGIVAHRGFAYFTAHDDQHGDELWRTDGTIEGTGMIKELVPGLVYPGISNFTSAESRLFFTYHRGGTVYLARTSGTPRTTGSITELGRLKAFQPSNYPSHFTTVGNSVFFRMGTAMYCSNGSASDLHRIGEFARSTEEFHIKSDWPAAMTTFNNRVYFVARKRLQDPLRVWRADCVNRTAKVAIPDLEIAATEARDVTLHAHDGRLFLGVMDKVGQSGGIYELTEKLSWRANWTRLSDIPARALQVANGKIYFAGFDEERGEEPWVMPLPPKAGF